MYNIENSLNKITTQNFKKVNTDIEQLFSLFISPTLKNQSVNYNIYILYIEQIKILFIF